MRKTMMLHPTFSGLCLALLAVLTIASEANAATASGLDQGDTTKASVDSPVSAAKKKKSTDVNFDDVLVQGKYHFSDEAVTTVEQDKVLDALLGVRTDFKDRLSKSTARH